MYYRKTSNISRTLVGNKIVDNSDVVGASPVGAAPTIFILNLTPGFNGLNRRQPQDDTRNILSFGILCDLYQRFYGKYEKGPCRGSGADMISLSHFWQSREHMTW